MEEHRVCAGLPILGDEPEWAQSEAAIIQPREGARYPGPLVVLTGPATYSSAETFLVPLRSSGRAVLVGGKTAGSTGNPIYVDLPRGGNFRVVSKRDLFPDGTEFVGYGIAPDVAIEPTQRDLVEGRDPVLEAGVEAIEDWGRERLSKPACSAARGSSIR